MELFPPPDAEVWPSSLTLVEAVQRGRVEADEQGKGRVLGASA